MTSPSAIHTPVLQSLEEIYHFAVANALPIAIYRLPGDKEPVTILQTHQKLNILQDGLEALGKEDGFVISPWKTSLVPGRFIKVDQMWKGWQPYANNISVNSNGITQSIEAESTPALETSFEL